MPFYQLHRLADAGQHAQCQAVDFEQFHGFQVILVPLDDGAIVHRCIFDRHHCGERRIGDHETADVLGQVTRVAVQGRGHG